MRQRVFRKCITIVKFPGKNPPDFTLSHSHESRGAIVGTARHFLSCTILLTLATARPAYTQNETTLPFLSPPPSDQSPDIHRGFSSGYSDDEMPDLWKKTRRWFTGEPGEILLTLPLFNQMDREAATQNFYIINWPLIKRQCKPTVSGEVGNNVKKPSQTANSSENHAGIQQFHKKSNDDKQPPEENQIQHTHVGTGERCYAPDCGGNRCRCRECLDEIEVGQEVDEEVRAKRSGEQTAGAEVIKKQKIEPALSYERKNILHLLANRALTGRFLQSDLTVIMHNRLERAAPVTIQTNMERKNSPIDVDLLPSGELASINYVQSPLNSWATTTEDRLALWPCCDLGTDRNTGHTLRFQPVGRHNIFPDKDWTVTRGQRAHILSNGKIVLTERYGHIILFKNRINLWQIETSDRVLLFLRTFRHYTDYYSRYVNGRYKDTYLSDMDIEHPSGHLNFIPSQIFDLVSTWDKHYILSTFRTRFIYSFIDSKNQLVIFTVLNGVLYRWGLLENKWIASEICNVSGCRFIRLILLEDDSALLIYKECSFCTYGVWTERDNQFAETAAYCNKLLALSNGALIFWNHRQPTPTVMIWEHISGCWKERILPITPDPESKDLNIIALQDGRLLGVDNGSTIKVFIDLDGQWHSMVVHQSNSSIKGIKQLNDKYIAAWCSDGSILIWDLYQR